MPEMHLSALNAKVPRVPKVIKMEKASGFNYYFLIDVSRTLSLQPGKGPGRPLLDNSYRQC
jgi:hypothetical protein